MEGARAFHQTRRDRSNPDLAGVCAPRIRWCGTAPNQPPARTIVNLVPACLDSCLPLPRGAADVIPRRLRVDTNPCPACWPALGMPAGFLLPSRPTLAAAPTRWTTMAARYWWQCIACGGRPAWTTVCESKSVAAFVRDELVPGKWDQRLLRRTCSCHRRALYITYRLKRGDSGLASYIPPSSCTPSPAKLTSVANKTAQCFQTCSPSPD